MEAKLVGLHTVKAKLKSGEIAVYHYAWRGGPKITAAPGTKAFVQEFARLTRGREIEAKSQTVGWLVNEYLHSADYQKLRPNTKRDYERITGAIRAVFGSMKLPALGARGARTAFIDWRDSMRNAPRSADMHMAVLARILAWAAHRELITRNPLEKPGKLHSGSRKDAIWMPRQLATLFADGAPHLVSVAKVALWTMQRQADILTMPTIAYDDGRLWITQGKTGARVKIRPADEIVPILDAAKAAQRKRVLVNSYGQHWTSDGFRASWGKELKRLGIEGVTFHDFRGTGISYAYAMGADVQQIADISGHSKEECNAIIRRHYLAGGEVIEAIRAGTARQ